MRTLHQCSSTLNWLKLVPQAMPSHSLPTVQALPEFTYPLHLFVLAAALKNAPNAPALLHVLLEEGASAAAASQHFPSPLDLLVDRCDPPPEGRVERQHH